MNDFTALPEWIKYAGVHDRDIDLFEGQYRVPHGMSYNSYCLIDSKTAVMDTVDRRFTHEWLDNVAEALGGRQTDYLVVQHMEPDHSANIRAFLNNYKNTVVVGNAKTFNMIKQFFGEDYSDRRLVVSDGDTLCLGEHTLSFVFAPMVHWPEVMLTCEQSTGTLFSADAFGRFGAADAQIEWLPEARRYYFGIVGKYGAQVQSLLKKASALNINAILPLHGPALTGDIAKYVKIYDIWSSYAAESDGITVAYTSVYGNTAAAVRAFAESLRAKGCPNVAVYDLARCDTAQAVADAFRYGKLVLASTTYNAGVFPFMREFIEHLTERGYKNRTVGFIENGSWAPMAAKTMRALLEPAKDIAFCETQVTIRSAPDEAAKEALEALANELCREYAARDGAKADKNDPSALFRIGYGLYVVTCNDGKRDNGLIVNTVSQVADNPRLVSVCINKQNYSYHVIKNSGVMNVNCLSTEAPFALFKQFGFQSGRSVDKFEGTEKAYSENGLPFLTRYINAFFSLKVENCVDLGSHGMFICSVTESRVISDRETMTYNYYQANVKPKPETGKKKGWVCKICGYVHESEDLPDDFICPLCKHGAADFEKL